MKVIARNNNLLIGNERGIGWTANDGDVLHNIMMIHWWNNILDKMQSKLFGLNSTKLNLIEVFIQMNSNELNCRSIQTNQYSSTKHN